MTKMTEFGSIVSVPATYILETVDPTGLINYQVTVANLSSSLHAAVGTEEGAEVNDAVSVGGGVEVPTGSKQGSNVEFRTLIAGSNVQLTQNAQTIEIGSIVSGGDVVGPASAVADDIALFDGTTGKLIKDAGTKVSDLASLSGADFVGTLQVGGAHVARENASDNLDANTQTGIQMAVLTQTQYDGLGTPDAGTLYFIAG